VIHVVKPVVVVHGGAGFVSEDRRPAHVAGVARAAKVGLDALTDGATPLESAVRAVEAMENDPHFNAGLGSSLNDEGEVELDAAVMSGDRRTGAVGALPPFANAIRVAQAVLEEGRHVLYVAEGAAAFAERAGFARLPAHALVTDRARRRLEARLAGDAGEAWAGGTVGAVASDGGGHVAAATSTGGTVGKARGRVGDTPIVGAGTYASDDSCAISATGVGEGIIRAALASRVFLAVEGGASLQDAVAQAMRAFGEMDGSGGLIAVGPRGDHVVKTNTRTMSYAIAREGEEVVSGI
jgi:beta-aspartyl-peptidase (threonine type)